jgi:polysaccharide biosynthesis protein PelD
MSANLDTLHLAAASAAASRPATPSPPRYVAGLRVRALLEIVAVLALALTLDALWGSGTRFAAVSPHPFWIVVVLAAAYYGTREGLAAVVLSAAALLLGNLPLQRLDEDVNAWLLRAALQPLSWCVAALVLGSLNDAFRHRFEALREELAEVRKQLRSITDAYARLQELKQNLEARVAGQLCTVYAMYNASRAIDRQGVGDVLVGVEDLVRTVMNPRKFSLFLVNGARLEAVVNAGWQAGDAFARDLESSEPLFEAIVTKRRFLVVTDPADEPLLRGQGLLAGPLVNEETGAVVGMLKIEAMGFLDLNLSNVQNFRVLCEWVGAALANAQRVEDLVQRLNMPAQKAAAGQP